MSDCSVCRRWRCSYRQVMRRDSSLHCCAPQTRSARCPSRTKTTRTTTTSDHCDHCDPLPCTTYTHIRKLNIQITLLHTRNRSDVYKELLSKKASYVRDLSFSELISEKERNFLSFIHNPGNVSLGDLGSGGVTSHGLNKGLERGKVESSEHGHIVIRC